jgi:hypothetical protein
MKNFSSFVKNWTLCSNRLLSSVPIHFNIKMDSFSLPLNFGINQILLRTMYYVNGAHSPIPYASLSLRISLILANLQPAARRVHNNACKQTARVHMMSTVT